MFTSLKSASEYAGAVSNRNSKMPGTTFAISPKWCGVGMKLAAIKGTTCHKCYAMKLYNMRPSVRMGWEANATKAVEAIARDKYQWAEAMAYQINYYAKKTGNYFHRWFDAGDLQSVEMLDAINLVCVMTPDVMHWLPTREAKIVSDHNKQYLGVAANLVIRISSTKVDDKPINGYRNTSTVHKNVEATGHVCPARKQGNACGDCRACWDRSVTNVSYPLH